MKRALIIVIFLILVDFFLFSGGVQEQEAQIVRPLSTTTPSVPLDRTLPEVVSIQDTYPDEKIYNMLGKNTVKSGYPNSILNVFENLSATYSPIIVYWEFIPYNEEVPSSNSTANTTATTINTEVISQELVSYSRNHIGLSRSYEILETYDSSMAHIIIMVECGKQKNKITDKISMIYYNFSYRLITPSDQIVIGKNNASLIMVNYYDPINKEIGEKTIADIWY